MIGVIVVHMTTTKKTNDQNNIRLRELIEQADLTQLDALALFNRDMIKPYSISGWKTFLADREAMRWRRFDDALLKHAEKVLSKYKKGS